MRAGQPRKTETVIRVDTPPPSPEWHATGNVSPPRPSPQKRKGLRRRKGRGVNKRSDDAAVEKTLHLVAHALSETSRKLIDARPKGIVQLDGPLYPYERGRKAIQTNIRDLRYTMVFWTLLGGLMWFYWASIVVHNTQIAHGYPKYAINAPGAFFSNRYGYEWAMVYMLWWNYMPIVLTMASISQMNLLSRADIHYALGGLVFVSNTFVFFSLSVIWAFFINTGATVDSMGSDPKACGIYFSSSKGVLFCPNVIACPGLTRSDLHRSDPFFQHWLFSLLFNAWLFFVLYQNQRLRTYGGWVLTVDDAVEQFQGSRGESVADTEDGLDAFEDN